MPNFAADVKELQQYTQKVQKLQDEYRTYSVHDVPKTHWCGHFIDPTTKDVIPDGNSCCFWHWVGLPTRWETRHPAYPYQEDIFKEYFEDGVELFYIGKTPKIGASQTWLQIAVHEAIKNPAWINGQVAIVVGTGGNEAEKMIDRCKELLAYKDPNGIPLRDKNGELITKLPIDEDYNTKKEFSLNSVEFRAHPANNVDSIRSQKNMRMIIVDEIAFFKMVEQQRVRDAFEHYIGGSDVVIVLITTAGDTPSGVAYDIETEEPSIYRKHIYDYNLGLVVHPESMTSLYNKAKLDQLRGQTSWTRNFLRVWGHGSGNIYNSTTIDLLSREFYPLGDIQGFPNVLSIDPAYGEVRTKTSSKFAGLGMYKENDHLYVRSAFELEGAADDEALERVQKEIDEYGYNNLIIDGHWTGIIKAFNNRGMHAYGVNYNQHGVEMTDMAVKRVNDMKVHFHPTFEEVCKQLKAVRRGDNGMPNKKLTRFDLGDTFHQAIYHFDKVGTFHSKKLKGRF